MAEMESTIGGLLYVEPTTCLSEYRVYTSGPIICIPFTPHYTHKEIPSKGKMLAQELEKKRGTRVSTVRALFVATMRHYQAHCDGPAGEATAAGNKSRKGWDIWNETSSPRIYVPVYKKNLFCVFIGE